MMRAQRVGILYGWMWLKQGLWLFKRNPFLWMFLTSILVVGMVGITMLPVLGQLALSVLFPAFFAGFMLGCHALAEEKPLEPTHLFAGFRLHGTPLISLGVIGTVLKLIIVGLLLLGGGSELLHLIASGQQPPNPEQALEHAFRQAGVTLPIVLILSMVLQTAIPFAVMLIVFRAAPPLPALLAALRAVLLNLLPLLVYGLMILPFAVLASLPYMLGWIVLLPILITSQYAIYRDMFPMPNDIAPPAGQAEPPAAG